MHTAKICSIYHKWPEGHLIVQQEASNQFSLFAYTEYILVAIELYEDSSFGFSCLIDYPAKPWGSFPTIISPLASHCHPEAVMEVPVSILIISNCKFRHPPLFVHSIKICGNSSQLSCTTPFILQNLVLSPSLLRADKIFLEFYKLLSQGLRD